MKKGNSNYILLIFFSILLNSQAVFAEKMELICNLDDIRGTKTNWNIKKYVDKRENFIFDDVDLKVAFSNSGKTYSTKFEVVSHSNKFVSSGNKEKGLYWENNVSSQNGGQLFKYFLFVDKGILEIIVKTAGRQIGPIIGKCGSKSLEPNNKNKLDGKLQPSDEDERILNVWRSRNPWFGKDAGMTAFAMNVHKELSKTKRVKIGSTFYFHQIDLEMRKNFPDYFKNSDNQLMAEIVQLVDSGKVQDALDLLWPLAQLGNDKAQAAIGFHYATGLGIKQNFKSAVDYYSSAAAQGNVHAMYSLGVAYQNGQGVPIDATKAADWYKLALKYGDEYIKSEANKALLTIKPSPEVLTSVKATNPEIVIYEKNVSDTLGNFNGRIKPYSGLETLSINREPVKISNNGEFSWSGYVPVMGKEVILRAVTSSGLTIFNVVELKRSKQSGTGEIIFAPLNPNTGRKSIKNSNAIALIIGIEDYENTTANVKYARNDANVFYDFARKKLGLSSDRIKVITDEEADLKGVWLSVKNWLNRLSVKDKTDVFIFYAGHGLSTDNGKDMFIMPHDGEVTLLSKTAISRSDIFNEVLAAGPKSVTVFLDTCYSGLSRGSESLISARPIVIKAEKQSVPDNFTVMTAARGDQTAKPLEEAKHGMFSYFLMKGMEGDADANNDNQITAGELHSYVQQNVVQQSSGSQTPEIQGRADKVLVRFQ